MQLILGGARSGKSRLAEERALEWVRNKAGSRLVYLATAAPGDAEMAARIDHHRARRGNEWHLVECPERLAEVLTRELTANTCVVVDCLTLWISNCLHTDTAYRGTVDNGTAYKSTGYKSIAYKDIGHYETWDIEYEKLLTLVAQLAQTRSNCELIMVSNEVGSGIVPLGELSRAFVDASGHLHQALARYCDQVTLVVAGLGLELKKINQVGYEANTASPAIRR